MVDLDNARATVGENVREQLRTYMGEVEKRISELQDEYAKTKVMLDSVEQFFSGVVSDVKVSVDEGENDGAVVGNDPVEETSVEASVEATEPKEEGDVVEPQKSTKPPVKKATKRDKPGGKDKDDAGKPKGGKPVKKSEPQDSDGFVFDTNADGGSLGSQIQEDEIIF